MPWTVDNPPPPAKNWPKGETEKCVAAANAVLAQGGTEEEAVHACIAAAGRSEGNLLEPEPEDKIRPPKVHAFSVNDSVALPFGGVGKIRNLQKLDEKSILATVEVFKKCGRGFVPDDEVEPVRVTTEALTASTELRPPRPNIEPVVNITKKQEAEITLYADVVDDDWMGGISASSVVSLLEELKDAKLLNVHINSPGGDVHAGYTIYNRLKQHKARKVVYVDGMAASIASVIAMAGDEIVMANPSMMMVHNAWVMMASGNAEELEKLAQELRKLDRQIGGVYRARTGLEESTIKDLMDAETWFTAEEAHALGFADRVEETDMRAAASIRPDQFRKAWIHHPPAVSKRDIAAAKIESMGRALKR